MLVEREFTIEEALKVQAKQLEWWKTILRDQYWFMLKDHVKQLNEKGYSSPYAVFRGCDIDNWVHNNCK